MQLVSLGRLQLEPDAYPRPKLLLLVCYLALEGGRSREHLRTLFWPQATNASASLRVALAQLKADLPGAVQFTDSLVSTDLGCDAVSLLEAFEAGDLARTVALYQGAFLDGAALSEWGLELEEWVLTTREFLAARVVEAHLRLAEEALAFSETAVVEHHAIATRNLTGAAPAEPDTLLRLYDLFVGIGHPLASDLRREADGLGLSLQRRTPHPASIVAPNNLPASLDTFVARQAERLELVKLLVQTESRLVTVVGPGGVGKSRLSLEVARELHRGRRFPDGVFAIFLESLESPEAAVVEILRVLQVMPRTDTDPNAQLLERLQSSDLLLVLDNFEHLIAYAVQLEQLLSACPKLKVLATSREPLRLAAEWLLRLEGLSVPTLSVPASQSVTPQDAVELFVQRAKRVSTAFSLEANHREVLEICRLVQGFPLGIELAAALTRAMPPSELAEALGGHLDVLEGAVREPHDRHQGIRAVFEHSWKLLKASEQRALIRMAVFRDGATRAAVTFVTEANLAILIALIDKSLVQASTDGRYRVHPLLSQYCLERLDQQPLEAQTAQTRHAQHHLDLLATLLPHLRGPEAQRSLGRIETDLENIRNAWLHALEDPNLNRFGKLTDMVLFFDRRGRAREGLELFERTIKAMEARFSTGNAERTTLLAEYLVNVAWLHYCLGQHRPAHVRAKRAAVLARDLGGSGLMTLSKALNTLGNVARTSNELEAAIKYGTDALETARAIDDPMREMICLENLANAEYLLGQIRIAKTHYLETIHLAKQIGDLMSVTSTKLSLGHLLLHHLTSDDFTECREVLESGLELAIREQIFSLEPQFHINLCTLELLMTNPKHARDHAERAFQLAQSIAEPSVKVEAILSLGRVSHAEGNLETALHHYQTSIGQAQTLQDAALVFEGLLALAKLRVATGDMRSAEFALSKVYHEAAPESWHKREAVQLLANSNLLFNVAFTADG